MKARCLVIAALASVALTLGACSHDQKKAEAAPAAKTPANMGFVNTKCPISGETLGEDGWDKVTGVDYSGKKYGFCCGNCAKKFGAMSDADKAKKIAALK